MATYEYGRIAKLARKLEESGVNQGLIDQIMQDGEAVRRSTKPEKKAGWMAEAMDRMDRLLDKETRYASRESFACCLGGKRLQISKSIAANNVSLEDRVSAADKRKFVFGHSVSQESDGKIIVLFSSPGLPNYRCVCLPRAEKPISITYCYCCGGHVKHHLQIALDRKLTCRALSSALSSGGQKSCSFEFTCNCSLLNTKRNRYDRSSITKGI